MSAQKQRQKDGVKNMSASAEDNGDDLNQEASVAGQQGREDDTSYCCVSEQVYVESGNEKKVLYLMCIGLTYRSNDNEDQPLFSLTEEPWSLLPKNSHVVRPKNTEYILEITRRIDLFNIVPAVPCCPSNWTRIQIMEWLEHNPIREAADIEFLVTNEVMRLRELLIRAQQEQGIDSGPAGQGGRNWRGIVPSLREIMCLTQDNVKRLFLARADTRLRQELDARNSDIRLVEATQFDWLY